MVKVFNKIKTDVITIYKSTNVVEIVFWWAVRIAYVGAIVFDEDQLRKFIYASNLLGTFAYSLLRFVSSKRSFIGRSSTHLQTLIVFTSFIGYFVGHATNIHDYFEKYDFFLHLVSGVTMVIIGYYLTKAVDKGRKSSPALLTIGSVGFSFLCIVAWEIFEFFCDYYIPDAANQAYNWSVPDDFFWFALFGNPQSPEQYPLLDTMIDIILASLTTALTGIILLIILKRSEKKRSENV